MRCGWRTPRFDRTLPGVRAGVLVGVLGWMALSLAACSRSPLSVDTYVLTAGDGATDLPFQSPRDEPAPEPDEPGGSLADDVDDPPTPACEPGTGDFIYLMTDSLALHRLEPRSGNTQPIGQLDCARPSEGAFSMAVDRSGTAIVSLRDPGEAGVELVRASTRNGSCERIDDYEPNQLGFLRFGMAFTAEPERGDEALYVYGGLSANDESGLGVLETGDWTLSSVGGPGIWAAELAGTPDGRLLALVTRSMGWDVWSLGEFDKRTGELIWELPLPSLPFTSDVDAFAVAYWSESLYAFLGRRLPSGQSETSVLRYRLDADEFETVSVLPLRIVGVGATTCEPADLAPAL